MELLIILAVVFGIAATVLGVAVVIILRKKNSDSSGAAFDAADVEKIVDRSSRETREELSRAFTNQIQTVMTGVNEIGKNSKDAVEGLKAEVSETLENIRRDNDEKLDKMRKVVENKLQTTISERFSESFSLINDSLASVTKRLGEMRTLTDSVTDLNKMLSNVKARGTWGEISLENILDNILLKSQYDKQVPVKRGSRELVDFAVKLPGKGDGESVLLPIDAKFPSDDYVRLQEAAERADKPEVERLRKELFFRIKLMARDIKEKYINPPKTTDFAIVYFPTEGLYSEVAQSPELMAQLQDLKVLPAGPTIIAALLNSLMMGFRTLQIQKKSLEIIEVFHKIKKEMGRFDAALADVENKLTSSLKSVGNATDRSKKLSEKIGRIELPDDETQAQEVAADNE